MFLGESVFALVAVPVPLGQAFSYAVPEALREKLTQSSGTRVLCEFGRRKVMGVVLETTLEPPSGFPLDRIKPILAVVDDEPAIPLDLLQFLRELAAYYLAPVGEVMRLALPAVERSQVSRDAPLYSEARVKSVGRLVRVAVPIEMEPDDERVTALKGQAKALYELLTQSGEQPISELARVRKSAASAVKRLEQAGLVRIEQRSQKVDPFMDPKVERDEPKALNEAQQAAVSAMGASLLAAEGQAFLLHGVTGSGKTEVYLQVSAQVLESGGGTIILVPEIALTPQLVARFRARFGDQIAVLHSGLTDSERYQMWRLLRSGERRIAVGARSALFAPVQNLRLVCVDEEHDSSFKQEEGVRYHARDMALLRAHRGKAVCVLGSATPSVGSVELAKQGKVKLLKLPERAHKSARLPEVEVINLRHNGPGPTGHRLISLPLFRALADTLDAKKQAILFLNRRGFAPSLICDSCGEIVQCPNCSVSLTFHRARGGRMRCHYCDFEARRDDVECRSCRSRQIGQEGVGTEGVEAALVEAFPNAKVGRLDRDVAEGLKSERILNQMRRGEIDILVGTQMVTKGHDLPDVALVGVLNADAALSLPDYQAAERTFQLLVQVAGRAGRGDTAGRVLIQTRNPEHAAVRFALSHDVERFAEQELKERKEANYPPYCRMVMVRIDSLNERLALTTAEDLAALARRVCGPRAEVMGPSPAPIERLRNRFRYRIILRAAKRNPLFEAANAMNSAKLDRRVRMHVDIDPVSML